MGILKVCKYINMDYSKVEKIKSNKQFLELRKNNDLILYIGVTVINDITYDVYCDYANDKYYIVNPEK